MQFSKTIRENLSAILRASSIEELWPIVQSTMHQYGFDRLMLISTKFATKENWGNMSDWLILSNHDLEVVEVFIRKGLFLGNAKALWPPGVQPGAYRWPSVSEFLAIENLNDSQIAYAQLRKDFEILAGYSIWFPEVSERRKGVLGLCARRGLTQDDVNAMWEIHGEDILLLANLTHLKLSTLPHHDQKKRLTTRQYEVLEWIADGKSGKDIATILGLSIVTVEKHLRHAREALGVETTAQAVQKVAVLNQLFLPKI